LLNDTSDMRLPARGRIFGSGLLALLIATGGQLLSPVHPAKAVEGAAPPGPDRVVPINVDYTAYTWWMATWDTNALECTVVVDHEGMPTLGDIYKNCGESIAFDYQEQPPCYVPSHKHNCEGYYLYLVDKKQAQRQITVKLPPPEVWISLEGCDSVSRAGTNICESPPVIVLTGQELLPNEEILRIEGTVDGTPFTCDPTCRLQLGATDADGASLQFWAWSSYGDSSEPFGAQIRVAKADEGNPDRAAWYVDVLSTQWQGVRTASCSDTWQSFPPVGGPPGWLSTPLDPAELSSDIPYNYLSANLIIQGAVDASACPDGGLLPDGGANTCGQGASRPAVDAWQNQFDQLIISTSEETGVPAQLLKNLFARESQFWPGVFKASTDAGLGQLTENGADTTLLWNPSFFGGYCPLVIPAADCAKGYVHLEQDEQQLLRQALVTSVNATCDTCALGIDLSRANFSVGVFARTLLASCEQTAQVVYNTVNQSPGTAASYEDLWKLTLVNYNAGPGCLSLVVDAAWKADHKLSWDSLSTHFTETCQPAKDYVDDISR
jgi:hypothetical protein